MMLAKPNGSYSSDDLAMLSRVREQATAASIEGAGPVFSVSAVPA